ncbi:MAG TPA: DUF951 domain-containing protein [Candidatus Atribacteria bacterium]|nr:DUF951 domain-containing protein [Candidatus Atribacteria bacterium]HPT78680.1 DUF951 domain-containing protein [Candidatus Atribacteria bacterium]
MDVMYNIGDIVQTRKKHPCGNDLWTVIRTGADFKIKCNNCGRIVMLDRESFLKRVKKLIKSETQPSI